jgi:hypothetical protein
MKAIIALTALLTASIATAERITIDGLAYDISTVVGTYDDHKELLASQPWFGHQDLAREFLIETYSIPKEPGVRRDGIPNFPNTGGNISWRFAYLDKVMADGRTVPGGSASMVLDYGECSLDGHHGNTCSYGPLPGAGTRAGYNTSCYSDAESNSPCYWAVATPASQPFIPAEAKLLNPVNPKKKGKTKVAIMGSAEFDVDQVDPSTVVLGSAGVIAGTARYKYVDDEDDLMDMVVSVNTQEIGIVCGDMQTTLTGETSSGDSFSSTVPIEEMVGCTE